MSAHVRNEKLFVSWWLLISAAGNHNNNTQSTILSYTRTDSWIAEFKAYLSTLLTWFDASYLQQTKSKTTIRCSTAIKLQFLKIIRAMY